VTRASRVPWWILALAAAIPPIVSGVLAAHRGWATTIDNPIIAVRAHDALTRHPPLVGMYITLTTITNSPTRLHHLGPLPFWLFAVPVRAGGPSGVGLVFGASAINALAAAGSVWVAHRLGGLRLATIVTVGAALLAWSLGGQVLHDPWTPHIALFPFLFFLLAAAATANGDVWLLPLAAFTASFVVQAHATYVVPVALAGVWLVVGLVLRLRARKGEDGLRAKVIRSLIVAGAVLVVCWIGPLFDQLFRSHNTTKVAGAVMKSYPRNGFGVAWRDLVHATSIPPVWLEPFTGVIKIDTSPGWFETLTSLLVLGALGGATWWAWSRQSWTHITLCMTAIAAGVGAFMASASAPVDYHWTEFLYPRRLWWIVGVFVWIALAHTALSLAAVRGPRKWERSDALAIGVGVGAIVIAMIAVWPRLGPAQDYGSAGFGPVRDLGAAVANELHGDGPWELRTHGDFAQSVVGPGVASDLILRGKPVLVPDTNFPDLGRPHFVEPDHPPAHQVLIVSGPQAGEPIPGYTMVGRWDPATAPEPYRSYHQTLLVVPLDPVAAYVSTPA
jgi:hypothetical protein